MPRKTASGEPGLFIETPAAAAARVADSEPTSAAPFVPPTDDLDQLRDAAATCRGCELYRDATQTVFGEGSAGAAWVLVGEQPGDKEDLAGLPFVGPAGRLLDRALTEAGIDRTKTYVTNAVKHFRFIRRDGGQRRIHEKPGARHIQACHPWLESELRATVPTVLVLLGATAGAAVMGNKFKLTANRGRVVDWPPVEGPFAGSDVAIESVVATVHPSAILRGPPDRRDAAFDELVADLRVARHAGGG